MAAVAGAGTGRRALLVVGAILTLAGCQAGPGDASDDAGPASAGSVELVERDVEAPEIFQVTEPGLWDGRPSLGGVWVAHPDVVEPERVIVRKTDTGSFVIGALFRRERDQPGPALQVSSDAAEALGMLAGAPTVLNVTALRRDEPAPVGSVPNVPPATEAIAAPEAIATAPLDPVAPMDSAMAAEPQTATAAPTASDLERPYVQIGIFSVEANARAAGADMEGLGIPARVLSQESQGRQFWRVLVGPATSGTERADLLDRVQAEGFPDAYFVRS